MRKPQLVDYLLLTLLSLIWASAFFNIKIATYSFGPITIGFLRSFLGAIPVLILCFYKKIKIEAFSKDWKWFAIPGVMVGLRFIHGMVLFELISLLFAFGLIFEKEKMKAWGWASAGVMLFLSASWSGMMEIWICAIGMVTFISPWFFTDGENESKFSFKERKYQQRLALWTPVTVVGLYLILTLVILISSIQNRQMCIQNQSWHWHYR